jgi:hypothetical protein
MDLFRNQNLRELLVEPEGKAVSIFIPTHRMGREIQGDPIRLKNLLSQAEDRLIEAGMRRSDALEMLDPAQQLVSDKSYWQKQSDGLAIYLARNDFKYYRLPIEFKSLLVISGRYHIKPLLPMLSWDGQFYILAISLNDIKLYSATRYTLDKIEFEDIPNSLSEALWFEDPEAQLQFRTAVPTPIGEDRGMFHGQGVGVNDQKDIIRRFFQRFDSGLNEWLQNDQLPLVLAGVDYLLPIYRQVTQYPHIVTSGVQGAPEEWSTAELHQKSWEIIQPIFSREKEDAISNYQELFGKDSELASNELVEVVRAAHYGRVETSFVAADTQIWGSFKPESGKVIIHDEKLSGDVDLLDQAAAETILNGGVTYTISGGVTPLEEGKIAAIFRFSYSE